MEQRTKNILMISGAVLLVVALTVTIIVVSKNNEENENKELDDAQKQNDTQKQNEPIEQPTPLDDGRTHPRFNVEGELNNPLSELKGRMLYAKREIHGGLGYANVRSSPVVDTGGWDFTSNKITTINSGTPIGKVESEQAVEYNGYAYRWLYVKLYKPVSGWWNTYTYGYLRADTVTIKPF